MAIALHKSPLSARFGLRPPLTLDYRLARRPLDDSLCGELYCLPLPALYLLLHLVLLPAPLHHKALRRKRHN
ncbi:uncharacterized protein K444DRAFT_610881 [Hyaloscypha bicolor E]|uniref:Uncharacterized protein n=1 Tax=Hyaloscypha bicolor E TaxID=1095630 RepID=A0A2J6TIL3_9HELO|nr:uncharacterized protein K444DRAFT_610881 [Hyaloscypha bicolor E]PMD62859.1 hypothetical protein K444DRAFT_610881 [Hyaloscypha bicolor E]